MAGPGPRQGCRPLCGERKADPQTGVRSPDRGANHFVERGRWHTLAHSPPLPDGAVGCFFEVSVGHGDLRPRGGPRPCPRLPDGRRVPSCSRDRLPPTATALADLPRLHERAAPAVQSVAPAGGRRGHPPTGKRSVSRPAEEHHFAVAPLAVVEWRVVPGAPFAKLRFQGRFSLFELVSRKLCGSTRLDQHRGGTR